MSGTEGKRIYAVGDVHGCLSKMDTLLAEIEADIVARPHDDPLVVFLGDYVDRGPDSCGVIERLVALRNGPLAMQFLIGNHDLMAMAFLSSEDPSAPGPVQWLNTSVGGRETLQSYGVEPDGSDPHAIRTAFADAIPAAHLAFLVEAATLIQIGGYILVHAGIQPGVPLDLQDPDDLVWIRGPFLSYTGPHPGIVVHGHTPVTAVQNWGNRIAVDTGAVFGGDLSCVILEDDAVDLLTAEGPVTLPVM